MSAEAPLLQARGVVVRYDLPRSLGDLLSRRPARALQAVAGIDMSVARGTALGIVGESGCGKSTLGRALIGLQDLSAGDVSINGLRVSSNMPKDRRRSMQMIFQDPYGALNPLLTVAQTLSEPIRVHRIVPPDQVDDRVADLMARVGLPTDLMHRRAGSLSGGQQQRVGIARALSVEPELIVADECVAALDVSIQAQVLNLLLALRAELGLTLIFISHDLGVVRQVCDRVAVLYLGRVVEEGPTDEVFGDPHHPYTRTLLAAAPVMRPDAPPPGPPPVGEPPSPTDMPPGCPYQTRCLQAVDACRSGPAPPLRPFGPRAVACHLHDPAAARPDAGQPRPTEVTT
ncbi:MAG: ABC transporter ATP-binding protein [Rubellimicrobium sp.]|nr:ABC transporter ATP-binding protein [Rubellimicrobium sp.]